MSACRGCVYTQGAIMEFVHFFNYFVSFLFMICYSYQFIYAFIPHIRKDKPHAKEKMHRYAVLICARNEQAVIANLIHSIRNQDYPSHLITIFVMADNCTDNTAQVAHSAGAVVYTRTNRALVGKGYALDCLLENIEKDYGSYAFDGYFVFDADNILSENYISEMNRTFSDGYEIVTSYRNSKNYGTNWITAGYGLWFLRESRYLNHSRHLLGFSGCVSGTGFMFSNRILHSQGGWPFHLLTEDIEFSANNILKGIKIGYCHTAQFFDEQPVTFSQSFTQRMRWAKGNFQVLAKHGPQLMKTAFLRRDFSCFDMVMNLAPAAVLTFAGLVVNGIACTAGVLAGRDMNMVAVSILSTFTNAYMMFFAMGALTTLTQWHSIHTKPYKKLMYVFTFPLFMMTYVPITLAALVTDVTWRPIAHTDSCGLASIRNSR